MLLLLLSLVAVGSAFDGSFNYGCNSAVCKIQFVVDQVAVATISETALINEVNNIPSNLDALTFSINNTGNANTTVFNTNFKEKFDPAQAQVNNVSETVSPVVNTAKNVADAAELTKDSSVGIPTLLTCIQEMKTPGYDCLGITTTVAATTKAGPTVTAISGATGSPASAAAGNTATTATAAAGNTATTATAAAGNTATTATAAAGNTATTTKAAAGNTATTVTQQQQQPQ